MNNVPTWKVSLIGKPDAIKRTLGTLSEKLEEPGKADFLRAKPALESLLNLNDHAQTEISFSVSGDASHVSLLMMTCTATHVD